MPNVVLEDARLSAQVRFTYIVLRKFALTAGGQPVTRRELARHVAVGVRQIARHLMELQQARLIDLESGRLEGAPNCYWIEDLIVRYGSFSGSRHTDTVTQGRPSESDPHDSGVLPGSDTDVPPPETSASEHMLEGDTGAAQQHASPPDLTGRLIALGIEPRVADDLVATHPRQVIAAALRVLRHRRPPPRNPPAWVVAAIRRGWVVSDRAGRAAPRSASDGPHPLPAGNGTGVGESAEAAVAAFEQRADQAFAELPEPERSALEEAAAQVVVRRFDQRTASSRLGAGLIRSELRRLVADRLGIPIPESDGAGDRAPVPVPRDAPHDHSAQ